MPSLRELQGALAGSVLRNMDAPLAAVVRADGIAFDGRLQVYRNNTFSSLTAALKDSFPVVCQLVDERFFGYAVQEYIRTCPPRAPRLAEYGADFADFLTGFEPVRHLAYLPDVARLEWAVNTAYHATDAPTLDPARIAAVPQERYPLLTFTPHPAVQLFESEFPVDRIWQAHQPGGDLETTIDVSSGGCRLLIDRHDQDIRFLTLDAAGFALASALCGARALQEAYEKAAAIDGAFDLIAALSMHLARGTFADFADPAA
ncbi:MAG TPA: DNA-binding domain-containing protein [Candidatus Acidoferrum sp.]|nr:DNA-binding domain-containing protein [Candidatus Acidoferrum sp.]